MKISKGIPQSFMVKADPDAKGAMLTSTGEYAIPAIDAYVSNIDHTHAIHKMMLKMMWACTHVFSYDLFLVRRMLRGRRSALPLFPETNQHLRMSRTRYQTSCSVQSAMT